MREGLWWTAPCVLAALGLSAHAVCAQNASEPVLTPTAPETAGTTAAQAPTPQETSSAEYRELVAGAIEQYARRNWTEAYALFLRAHALSPSARTLRGMGASAFEAKQYVRAVEHMRQALVDTSKPLDPAQRDEATLIITRAETFIARVTLQVQPVDAQVEVDSHRASFDAAGQLLLDPGMHQLQASKPGYVSERRAVEVNPGDALSLELHLTQARPLAQAHAQAAPASTGRLPATPTPVDTHETARTWAWLSAGTSVVLAGTGTALYLLARSGVNAVESACPAGSCSAQQIERQIDREHLEQLQAGYILAFALAGASAATSIVLFTISPSEVPEASAVSLRLSPGGIDVRGAF